MIRPWIRRSSIIASMFSYQKSAGDALELYPHPGMWQALILAPVTETDDGEAGPGTGNEAAIEKA